MLKVAVFTRHRYFHLQVDPVKWSQVQPTKEKCLSQPLLNNSTSTDPKTTSTGKIQNNTPKQRKYAEVITS